MDKVLSKYTAEKFLGETEQQDFHQVTKNEEITIPEGIEEIEAYAFMGIKGLKIVNLPSTLKAIYSKAFAFCEDLKQINCSSPTVKVCDGVFLDCQNIENINIAMNLNNEGLLRVFNGEDIESIPKSLKTFRLGEICNGKAFSRTYTLADNPLPTEIRLSNNILFKATDEDEQ